MERSMASRREEEKEGSLPVLHGKLIRRTQLGMRTGREGREGEGGFIGCGFVVRLVGGGDSGFKGVHAREDDA
ncbi:uncharacterized protein A4U43_C06F4610 [Asparagus officinalis]|uniref:Uncharacterized protein n=1 Tax=Asparagus officinalis TaxID=4686 RepID=A0A5P1EJS7_ASPOF|nr:uncharacterized protein A4U43_C06F4610 [Asparagus officinalis]